MPNPTNIIRFVRLAKRTSDLGDAAPLIVKYNDVTYKFPAGTDVEQAKRIIWNKVLKPQSQKAEEKIVLEGDSVTTE